MKKLSSILALLFTASSLLFADTESIVMPKLKSQSTQSRSQSSSTVSAQVSGTTYKMRKYANFDLSRVTRIIECIKDFDWKNIRDNDLILVKNLKDEDGWGNAIVDRHGHELPAQVYRDISYHSNVVKSLGSAEFRTMFDEKCGDGKWDKGHSLMLVVEDRFPHMLRCPEGSMMILLI